MCATQMRMRQETVKDSVGAGTLAGHRQLPRAQDVTTVTGSIREPLEKKTCPMWMADGRVTTDYKPRCAVNEEMCILNCFRIKCKDGSITDIIKYSI